MLLYIIDLFGTAIFAISGVFVVDGLKMGLCVAVLVTAIGGGTIRRHGNWCYSCFLITDTNLSWVIIVTCLWTMIIGDAPSVWHGGSYPSGRHRFSCVRYWCWKALAWCLRLSIGCHHHGRNYRLWRRHWLWRTCSRSTDDPKKRSLRDRFVSSAVHSTLWLFAWANDSKTAFRPAGVFLPLLIDLVISLALIVTNFRDNVIAKKKRLHLRLFLILPPQTCSASPPQVTSAPA